MSTEKITKDNMPFVAPDDDGIRPAGKPDECFYCKQKVGDRHLWKCVAVDKKVLVKFELTLEDNVPVSWDREQIEFHYNKSSWCGSNIVELVKRNFDKLDAADNCGCNVMGEAKYIEDGDIVAFCNGKSKLIPNFKQCPFIVRTCSMDGQIVGYTCMGECANCPAEHAKDKEIENLKAVLKDMCELWESMGTQIPPLLNEQKYLNAKAINDKYTNVPTNAPDMNDVWMEE